MEKLLLIVVGGGGGGRVFETLRKQLTQRGTFFKKSAQVWGLDPKIAIISVELLNAAF